MKTGYLILSVAVPLLSSCASQQKAPDSYALNIKPVYSIRHSTETPEGFYQLGRYYQGQNRLELALEAYQKALAINGNFAEASNGLGVVYAMEGRQQEALVQFRLAVKLAPNAAHIQNNLGYALYLSKSYAEAASALERAVALNPANQAAHINLALALDKAGNREKAVQVMAQVPQLAVPPVAPLPEQVKVPEQVKTVTSVPAQVAATAEISSPATQTVLALPKNWGVITQTAPQSVPLVASHMLPPEHNAYELREQTPVQADRPLPHASVPPVSVPLEKNGVVAVQAAQQPVPAVKIPAQIAPMAAGVADQRAAAAGPYKIEVSNGNGVTGMARKVAGFLNGEGYARAHLTNQKPFHVVSSQVQYRSGYREQAQSLALTLPRQPGIAQADNLRGNVSIRVVLGKDISGNVAYFVQGKLRLASD